MIEALCKLVQDNYKYLNISIGYTKITDWCIEVCERKGVGEDERIVCSEGGDLTKAAAEAYIKTVEWLCDNKGGY